MCLGFQVKIEPNTWILLVAEYSRGNICRVNACVVMVFILDWAIILTLENSERDKVGGLITNHIKIGLIRLYSSLVIEYWSATV